MKINNLAEIKSFLFNNETIKQTIVKNTFWMAVADAIAKILRLMLLIYVARILGATEYGEFSFAFAFVFLFAFLADLGVGEIVIREFAKDNEKEKEFPFIISLRLISTLSTLLLVFIGSFFITQDPVIRSLIWILAIFLLTDSFFYLFCCFFRARQQMQYEAFAKIFQTLILTGAGFFMLFNFPSIEGLSYAYLFAGLTSLIFLFSLFLLKGDSLKIKWDWLVWKRYLLMSWPLALTGVLTMIYGQIDSVMMGRLNQITETGWYNASYRIIGASLIVNGLIATAFYPALSKHFKESKEILKKIWSYQMEIMIFLAVPLVVGGIILAPQLIGFVYGSSFFPAILVFQILVVMCGIAYLQTPFNHILIVTNQQKKLFWAVLLGTVVNIILNLILIPKYSLYGAAVATVFTWLVLFLICIRFTYRYTPINPLQIKFFWITALASISGFLMALVIKAANSYHFHFLISAIIGIIIYSATFFLFKNIIKKLSYIYVKK